jgi:GNAT superfamily N-acetyltransferase
LRIGGVLCAALPLLPIPMLNRAIGLGEETGASDQELDGITQFFGDAGVRHYVSLTPQARPPDLRDGLRTRGYEPGYHWAKFTRSTEDAPTAATQLDVRLVGPEAARDFARVVVAAYDMPKSVSPAIGSATGPEGWSCYVAYEGDAPAAAGALFVHDRTGWLGFAGTLPEHRGKGGQGAILAARIDRAREEGCDLVVTETGVPEKGRPSNSYRNILRSGFEQIYVRENYLSAA